MTVAQFPGCDELRRKHKMSPVQRGKIPRWLKNILSNQNSASKSCGELESRVLFEVFSPVTLEHCGTTDWHSIPSCFVSEPYQVSAEEIIQLREKGCKLGFAVAYDPLSYYYPGACHRIVLFPTTTSLSTASHPDAIEALLFAGGKLIDGVRNSSSEAPRITGVGTLKAKKSSKKP